MGRAHALCPWQGRLALCPLLIPPRVSGVSQGSVAPCCCCPDCVTHSAGRCRSWGASAGTPGPLRPSPLPYPWPETAPQVPTSSLHPLAPGGGGTGGQVSLVQGAVPTSCQHPPQTLLPYTCSPPGPPSSLGRHLCPQPPWQRATSLHCFHPNPTASHRSVSPGVPEPLPAPSPLPSVPSAASLGMAPCALHSGSVSGQ